MVVIRLVEHVAFKVRLSGFWTSVVECDFQLLSLCPMILEMLSFDVLESSINGLSCLNFCIGKSVQFSVLVVLRHGKLMFSIAQRRR